MKDDPGPRAIVTGVGHDLTRVPILPQPVTTKGEGPEVEEDSFTPIKGELDEETGPATPVKGEGAKKVSKTELAGPTAGTCGAYSWRVRFSVANADVNTTGYIVQKVNATYSRKDCTGTNKPVTGIGTFPFWEAWGVRQGQVFVGDSASPHNADTYADDEMGDSYGSIVVKGVAEFFPNVVLPAHMKANNPDTQALALRSSLTDPGLTGGTGSIAHDLTASWDCCGPLTSESPQRKTRFSDKR